MVPALAGTASKLLVFQRTPSPIDVRGNGPTTEAMRREELSAPGWQKRRQDNFIAMVHSTEI